MLFYVAGPLSNGGGKCLLSNIVKAVEIGEQLYERGYWCYIPHMIAFQQRILQRTHFGYDNIYNRWLSQGIEILGRCDALYFIAPSKGANLELIVARQMGIPVYRNIDDVPVDDEELEKRREKE